MVAGAASLVLDLSSAVGKTLSESARNLAYMAARRPASSPAERKDVDFRLALASIQ
jgi:hypothetical protein